jgi:ribosome biogenesis GTPase
MGGEQLETGRVIRLQAGFYTVQGKDDLVMCQLRGRLKKGEAEGDIVAVGDLVDFSRLPEGSGIIEGIHPRRKAFVRMAPRPHGEYQQIMLANPDQIMLVFACTRPEPNLRLLDRFLVIAEKEGIPPVIVVNKIDLLSLEEAGEIFEMYPPLGYPLLFTSAASGRGIDEMKQRLEGKISLLAGPSGVGKTSLLNAMQPQLGLQVSAVSELTSKGRHTTSVRELFPLEGEGYVADMPGIRSLALWDIEPEELDGYFPEMRPLVAHCKFSDCTHLCEPECAVLDAVEEGSIHPDRYESYLRMRFGDVEIALQEDLDNI